MSRRSIIFILTHGYPLFIASHLYFGDWCRKCQVLFNVIPLIVFGGLFIIWESTSNIRLDKSERLYLKFFLYNLFFIYCYYCLCIFSLPSWAHDKNWQVSCFIIITLIFYGLNHERK